MKFTDRELAIFEHLRALGEMPPQLRAAADLTSGRIEELVAELVAYRSETHGLDLTALGPKGPLAYVDWNEWGGRDIASGETISGLLFHEGSWTGIHHGIGGPLDDSTVEDVALVFHKEWGSQLYEARKNNRWRRVRVSAVRDEHALYARLAGYGPDATPDELLVPSFTVEDSIVSDCGGQGLQFEHALNRPNETSDPVGQSTRGGPVIVRRSAFLNCGMWYAWERAAFGLSFFRNWNPLEIEEVLVDKSMQVKSTGCLLLCGGGECPATITDSRFLAGVLTQPIAEIRDRAEVHLRGCHFEAAGGQSVIKFDRCGRVTLEDCSGNVALRVDGEPAGTISDPDPALRV